MTFKKGHELAVKPFRCLVIDASVYGGTAAYAIGPGRVHGATHYHTGISHPAAALEWVERVIAETEPDVIYGADNAQGLNFLDELRKRVNLPIKSFHAGKLRETVP